MDDITLRVARESKAMTRQDVIKKAADFRKVAAKLIQRFPEVVEPLREGKLCITSLGELARVMTPENREETLPRFFHMSKRQARAVAAAASWSLQGGVHMAEPRHGCRVSSGRNSPEPPGA
jgi:hypothetical protein